jgi:DNA-binding transcriptional LysR family regulator
VAHNDAAALQILERKSPVISVPDFRLIRRLVLDHQGIAVLPQYLIKDDLNNGSIIQLLPELAALRVWVNCISERGRQERLCEALFIKKFNTR